MMSFTEVWETRSKLAYWRNATMRPDFWLAVVCSLLVVWAAGQLLFFGFGRDQSIYALVGRGILEGDMPYRERWDFKPPGVFLVYGLAEALFGSVMWGPRLLEAVGLLSSAWLLVSLSETFFADRRPGYLAAAIASVVHVQLEFWHTGQPESYAGFSTVMALVAVSGRAKSRGRKYARWVFAGLCFGAAFLLKPPLGGGAVVAAVFLLKQEWEEATAAHKGAASSSLALALPFVVIGLGAMIPIVVVGAWFWSKGAWDDLAWTLFEFTPGYTKLGWTDNAAAGFYRAVENALTRHSALFALGLVAAGFGGPISTREREGLGLVLGVLAVQLAGIGMQAKYFEYHYGASVPLLAFIAGLGWFKIWRAATREHGGGAVAFASLVVVVGMARLPVYDVPEGFWVRAWERTKAFAGASEQTSQHDWDRRFHFCADFNLAADRDVADWLKANGGPTDTVFVWGFEPAIYWFLGRPLASRFIYDVPQRVGWEHERARAQLLRELERAKPTWFVVQHHDYFKFVTGNDFDSRAALDHDPELSKWVNASYRRVDQVEDFELYRRAPTTP
jgi:hypothetical protein